MLHVVNISLALVAVPVGSGPVPETETVSQLASLPARVVVSPYTVHFDTAWIIDCSSTIITTCIGRDLP